MCWRSSQFRLGQAVALLALISLPGESRGGSVITIASFNGSNGCNALRRRDGRCPRQRLRHDALRGCV